MPAPTFFTLARRPTLLSLVQLAAICALFWWLVSHSLLCQMVLRSSKIETQNDYWKLIIVPTTLIWSLPVLASLWIDCRASLVTELAAVYGLAFWALDRSLRGVSTANYSAFDHAATLGLSLVPFSVVERIGLMVPLFLLLPPWLIGGLVYGAVGWVFSWTCHPTPTAEQA